EGPVFLGPEQHCHAPGGRRARLVGRRTRRRIRAEGGVRVEQRVAAPAANLAGARVELLLGHLERGAAAWAAGRHAHRRVPERHTHPSSSSGAANAIHGAYDSSTSTACSARMPESATLPPRRQRSAIIGARTLSGFARMLATTTSALSASSGPLSANSPATPLRRAFAAAAATASGSMSTPTARAAPSLSAAMANI